MADPAALDEEVRRVVEIVGAERAAVEEPGIRAFKAFHGLGAQWTGLEPHQRLAWCARASGEDR